MNKFFQTLAKPARLIFVICAIAYSVWFAVRTGSGIGGGFMSTVTNIIVLFVGAALLVSVPILLLLKKDDQAKVVFLVLVGYWLISSILEWFGYAQMFAVDGADGLTIVTGIFYFISGLGLVGLLVLIALEFALKNSLFRFIAFLVLLGVVAFAFLNSIFVIINVAKYEIYPWAGEVDMVLALIFVPIMVFFGYLTFFGVPAKNGAKK